MLLADDDRRYVAVNPAACRLFGISSEEFVGRTIDELTPPDMQDGVEDRWRAFLAEGAQSGDYALVMPDGRRRSFEYSAVAGVEPGRHLAIILTLPPERGDGPWTREGASASLRGQRLSPREREVMTHIAAGATGAAVAALLDISPETVRNHVRSAREKLGARTKAHAIALAVQAGEISLTD